MRAPDAAGMLYRQALRAELEAERTVLGPPSMPGTHWSESHRRRTGAFYTPHHLVQFVVRHALFPSLREIRGQAQVAARGGDLPAVQSIVAGARRLRVVDPACGCGRFLLMAFRPLRALYTWLSVQEMRLSRGHVCWGTARSQGAGWALDALLGFDLNPRALEAAREVLLAAAGADGGTIDLRVADLTSPRTAVLAPGSANVCIGNPPWGARGAGALAAAAVGLPVTNANTFGIFLMRCLQSLIPGGRLGLVLPRNFCKGNDYAPLRRRLLEAAALEWLGDAGQAFPGVLQEAVVVVARRLRTEEQTGDVRVVSLPGAPMSGDGAAPRPWWPKAYHCDALGQRLLPQVELQKTRGWLLPLKADEQMLRLLQHMEQVAGGWHLRRWVEWGRGLEYGRSGALICCPGCGLYSSLPKKKRASKPCAGCGRALTRRTPQYHLISQHRDARHTVAVYAGQHVRRYRLGSPYWLDPVVPGVNYKKESLFAGPKILVPKISPSLVAALDASDAYTTQGVYVLRPRLAPWDIYALLGLINSLPMAFYYECRYNDGASLTTNVTLRNLLALPLPRATEAGLLATMREGARALVHSSSDAGHGGSPAAIDLAIDNAAARLFRLSADQDRLIKEWRDAAASV